MLKFKLVFAVLRFYTAVAAFVDYGTGYPKKYSQTNNPSLSTYQSWQNTTLTLSPTSPFLALDYGFEIAGFPFFHVSALSSPVQIEVKYSETLPALAEPNSDGPWTFSNGLSNTFRVETFNITEEGYIESFFVQGGQRWESIRLLNNATVDIAGIGFRLTGPRKDAETLPGRLSTSNAVYDRIYGLGGGSVQVACVDAGNAPSTWEITDQGALVRGQASAQSAKGLGMANYTLAFKTKIVRGGTGWRVASAFEPYGPYFVLTSNYPEGNTFVNTNRTLLPPNVLIFNSAWSLVNQSTLPVPANQYYPVNFTIEEDIWYHISTVVTATGYQVTLDGQQIAFVPLPPPDSNALFATPSPYEGSWGFGGYQDHVTYFANVSVTARNGTSIYSNAMTSNDTLAEYSVAPLDASVCLDGGKRDRLVWIGDFYHTVRVVAHSTSRWDQLLGSIAYVFRYQVEEGPYAGFVPISPALGSRAEYKEAKSNWDALIDYQDLFLAGIGEYYRYTGDLEGLKPHWAAIQKVVAARLAFIDPNSGLVAGSPQVPMPRHFNGPVNGTAVTGLMAFMLDLLTPLASAMDAAELSTQYATTASRLRTAINNKLWNEETGTYALSLTDCGNHSLQSTAFAILSGAANLSRATSSIAALEDLRFSIGYKTLSSDTATPDYQLAPNPSGFLLEALFQVHAHFAAAANSTPAIQQLLDNLWAAMVNDDEYYSGAGWEYVKPDGSPGIDGFTSLSHPWGAAPTYVFAEYLLGVQPTRPGYERFSIRPMLGYLGLKKVQGRVATPRGAIEVAWEIAREDAVVEIVVPEGLTGVFEVPSGMKLDGRRAKLKKMDLASGTWRFEIMYAE